MQVGLKLSVDGSNSSRPTIVMGNFLYFSGGGGHFGKNLGGILANRP